MLVHPPRARRPKPKRGAPLPPSSSGLLLSSPPIFSNQVYGGLVALHCGCLLAFLFKPEQSGPRPIGYEGAGAEVKALAGMRVRRSMV